MRQRHRLSHPLRRLACGQRIPDRPGMALDVVPAVALARHGFRDARELPQEHLGRDVLRARRQRLLSLIRTWQACDISAKPLCNGDRGAALAAITARSIVLPCRSDFCFPPEDNAREVAAMPNAELRVIDPVWGHYAGGGRNQPDTDTIDAALRELRRGGRPDWRPGAGDGRGPGRGLRPLPHEREGRQAAEQRQDLSRPRLVPSQPRDQESRRGAARHRRRPPHRRAAGDDALRRGTARRGPRGPQRRRHRHAAPAGARGHRPPRCCARSASRCARTCPAWARTSHETTSR